MIVPIWRCHITKNPIGTDTEMIGRPCQCQPCRMYAEIEQLRANLTTAEFDRLANEAEIERLRQELLAADNRERVWANAVEQLQRCLEHNQLRPLALLEWLEHDDDLGLNMRKRIVEVATEMRRAMKEK